MPGMIFVGNVYARKGLDKISRYTISLRYYNRLCFIFIRNLCFVVEVFKGNIYFYTLFKAVTLLSIELRATQNERVCRKLYR